jgi:hypothetical protein
MRNTTSCKYSLPYCQILVLKLVSDSYPAGLGALLVKDIPADPDAYRKWLEQKRREYTEIEESMSATFLPSPQMMGNIRVSHAHQRTSNFPPTLHQAMTCEYEPSVEAL